MFPLKGHRFLAAAVSRRGAEINEDTSSYGDSPSRSTLPALGWGSPLKHGSLRSTESVTGPWQEVGEEEKPVGCVLKGNVFFFRRLQEAGNPPRVFPINVSFGHNREYLESRGPGSFHPSICRTAHPRLLTLTC